MITTRPSRRPCAFSYLLARRPRAIAGVQVSVFAAGRGQRRRQGQLAPRPGRRGRQGSRQDRLGQVAPRQLGPAVLVVGPELAELARARREDARDAPAPEARSQLSIPLASGTRGCHHARVSPRPTWAGHLEFEAAGPWPNIIGERWALAVCIARRWRSTCAKTSSHPRRRRAVSSRKRAQEDATTAFAQAVCRLKMLAEFMICLYALVTLLYSMTAAAMARVALRIEARRDSRTRRHRKRPRRWSAALRRAKSARRRSTASAASARSFSASLLALEGASRAWLGLGLRCRLGSGLG